MRWQILKLKQHMANSRGGGRLTHLPERRRSEPQRRGSRQRGSDTISKHRAGAEAGTAGGNQSKNVNKGHVNTRRLNARGSLGEPGVD